MKVKTKPMLELRQHKLFFLRSATTTTTTTALFLVCIFARSVARRARRHPLPSTLDTPRALKGEKSRVCRKRESLFSKERTSVIRQKEGAWLKKRFLAQRRMENKKTLSTGAPLPTSFQPPPF